MDTVSIRDLRGKSLREKALNGKPVAITNRGALIGVVIPVAQAWVEHLIDYNWSHVRQSIAEGEQELTRDARMTTIQDVLDAPDPPAEDHSQEEPDPAERGGPTVHLAAALVGGAVSQPPETSTVIGRLQSLLNPVASRQRGPAAEPSVRTVRIGSLTAELIEQAGDAGQTLAVTHDRELIGIVIPVTRHLVEFLIEQNMSRILYNIGLSEKQIGAADAGLMTIDQAVAPHPKPPRE
jgi:PHD/YefM family antitoxin component YafN of YafNO toxin-antitoxin module